MTSSNKMLYLVSNTFDFISYTGHPEPPDNVRYSSTTIPSLTWNKKFNGGLTQTFVIETANVQDNIWTNQTLVNEFDIDFIKPDGSYEVNITGLSPGQYNTRMYAFNLHGQSAKVELDSTFEVKKSEGRNYYITSFFL